MAKKSFLDSVDVPIPCSEKWDEMTGGEKSRFCASCENDIYNISAMTRKEAKKLLFQSNEKVCIRIEKDAEGKIKTLKKQLHQITRRAPIAASVLSASLTFSALTYAQGKPVVGKPKPNISAEHKEEQKRVSISGTVTDLSGAVVPGAAIKLVNVKDDSNRSAFSNAEGFYEFKNVAASVYRIEAEQNGFKNFVAENIKIDNDKNLHLTIVLDSIAPTDYAPVAQETNKITSEPQSISDKIETRQIETLPLPRGTVFVLGMFPGVAQKPTKKVSSNRQTETSQISFIIYDVTGAVISEAQVNLINQKTKEKFTASTNQEGVVQFNLIAPGKYDLEAFSIGFQTYRKIIEIKEQIEPNVKITLNVGTVGEYIIIEHEISVFQSIAQKDTETVKQLINANFNVNTKDDGGQTALHIAVQHENLEIIRFLLDKGAKVNTKDKQKLTPLAMMFDSFGGDEKTTREIIRLLVAKGADIDMRNDDDGDATFLMSASEDDNVEMVKFLLELGSNPNLKDEDGETAMQKTDSEEIKQILRRYGARN